MVSQLEILTKAAAQLAGVLDDAGRTVNDPDYWGSEWLEVCQGNALLPTYVVVDFLGNVFHVRRSAQSFADERIVLTYLPSWFALVLDNVPARVFRRDSPGRLESINAEVSDRHLAVPMRIEMAVRRPTNSRLDLRGPGEPSRTAVLPQVTYGLGPSRGSMLLRAGVDRQDAATGGQGIERVHWIAPSIRISAAPGAAVGVSELYPSIDTAFDPWSIDLSGGVEALASTPFWGWFVMNAAREHDDAARARAHPVVTSQQALAVHLERFQHAEALPPPGAPRRTLGLSEVDLLATGPAPGARFEETTRPDGVDLVFLTEAAAAGVARARRDPLAALAAALDPYVFGVSGGLPPNSPIPAHIRVDPQSPDDRFAYSVTYLDQGRSVAWPPRQTPGLPLFRLSVVRTAGVSVSAGLLVGPRGAEQIAEVLDYREQVVDFDDVPAAILDDGASLPASRLPSRTLTAEELADVVQLAIGLVPWPPCQVVSDLTDYATILRYLYDGKDLLGRDMGRLDFALTCAGILLPEVLERVAKQVARVVTAGDEPATRIGQAFGAVTPTQVSATNQAIVAEVGG